MITGYLRAQVWFKAVDGRCDYCGDWMGPFEDFTVDHVVPISRGGQDDIGNLVPCCRKCNTSKRARTLEEFREFLTLRNPDREPHVFWFETEDYDRDITAVLVDLSYDHSQLCDALAALLEQLRAPITDEAGLTRAIGSAKAALDHDTQAWHKGVSFTFSK